MFPEPYISKPTIATPSQHKDTISPTVATTYSDNDTMHSAIGTSPEAYLIKPFKRQELIASVRLAFHKTAQKPLGQPEGNLIECGNGYVLDRHRYQVFHNGSPIGLTKKEMQLFELLLARKEKLVPFEEVEYELWPDKEVSAISRRTLIHRLRSKLAQLDIQTVGGVGCILRDHPPLP